MKMRVSFIVYAVILLTLASCGGGSTPMNTGEILSVITTGNEPNFYLGESKSKVKEELTSESRGFEWEEGRSIARKSYSSGMDQVYFSFTFSGDIVSKTSIHANAEGEENRSAVNKLYSQAVEKIKESKVYTYRRESGDEDSRNAYFESDKVSLVVSLLQFNGTSTFEIYTEGNY